MEIDGKREYTEDDIREYEKWADEQVSQGLCPYSGMLGVMCKAHDMCDCFEFPQWEDEEMWPEEIVDEALDIEYTDEQMEALEKIINMLWPKEES